MCTTQSTRKNNTDYHYRVRQGHIFRQRCSWPLLEKGSGTGTSVFSLCTLSALPVQRTLSTAGCHFNISLLGHTVPPTSTSNLVGEEGIWSRWKAGASENQIDCEHKGKALAVWPWVVVLMLEGHSPEAEHSVRHLGTEDLLWQLANPLISPFWVMPISGHRNGRPTGHFSWNKINTVNGSQC